MVWSKNRQRPYEQRKGRADVLSRAAGQCQIKGPGCTRLATIDDHVVPLSLGGSLGLHNRQAACKTCHDLKTARDARSAKTAIQAKAKPPARKHPGLK
ncbi:HNH endonuclease [Microlunatus sagamiharensis]